MKRMIGIIIISLLILTSGLSAGTETAAVSNGKFALSIGAGMRAISEDMAKNVYGNNNLAYSIDLSYSVSKSLDIFLHTDYMDLKGDTTFTGEAATLSIVPLELGVRVRVAGKRFVPFAGLGAGYYMIKDEIAINSDTYTFEKNQVGFFIEAGIRFYVTRAIFVHAGGKYIFLNVKPDESTSSDATGILYYDERNLGGFMFGAGMGIRF